MFNVLKWQKLSDRNNYFIALMVFKCLNDLAPPYLQNKFNFVRDSHERNTRQAIAGLLSLPPRINGNDLESFKHSFRYKGVKVWNNVEEYIRNSHDVQCFQYLYKTYYWN